MKDSSSAYFPIRYRMGISSSTAGVRRAACGRDGIAKTGFSCCSSAAVQAVQHCSRYVVCNALEVIRARVLSLKGIFSLT